MVRMLALGLLFGLMVLPSCTSDRRAGDDDDDASADDDDAADDDDEASDDDDFTFEDPPVFLASYDFTFVMLENEISGDYSAIHGQMDISVSATAFLAEMNTTDGDQWDFGGSLDQNAQSFQVRGWMTPPGVAKEVFIEVVGNFLADVDGTPSESCLTGLGSDDDPNLQDQGINFVWYGCQSDAAPSAIDRSGSHSVIVTVNGNDCGAWTAGTWLENWSFEGRNLTVTRNAFVGYGIVSDDGQIFRFTMLEQANPGRALKVVGDFTNPAGTTEATAIGYCHNNPGELVGGSLFLDY
jgi:hypothetical protein